MLVGCSVIDGYDKDVIVLEPHPHHILLASFGKDTAETEEGSTTLTCGVKCKDTVCCHSIGLRLEALIITWNLTKLNGVNAILRKWRMSALYYFRSFQLRVLDGACVVHTS